MWTNLRNSFLYAYARYTASLHSVHLSFNKVSTTVVAFLDFIHSLWFPCKSWYQFSQRDQGQVYDDYINSRKFMESFPKVECVCACLFVLSCKELKMLVQYRTTLHVCPCVICTFAMYLESVDFIFTDELYIKIDVLKFMNIYCSQYSGPQLFFPSVYFQLTYFTVPLNCKLWYTIMLQLFSCLLYSFCYDVSSFYSHQLSLSLIMSLNL